MSFVLPGRMSSYLAGADVEALFDLWNLDPKNSTLGSTLTATGTTPPAVTLTGTLTTPYGLRVEITGAGALGVAVFRVSLDNGTTWVASSVTTAATYAVPGTAIVLNFASGNYATDNVYRATVATAVDVSPKAINGAQATPANQPFFNAKNANFNGNPTWDGPNASQTNLGVSFASIVSPTTHVFVCMTTDASAQQTLFHRVEVATGRSLLYTPTTGTLGFFGTQSSPPVPGNLSRPSILAVTWDGVRIHAWLNGNRVCSFKDGLATLTSFMLMNIPTFAYPWIGSVADARYASRPFSIPELRSVFNYFSLKHAIPIAMAA